MQIKKLLLAVGKPAEYDEPMISFSRHVRVGIVGGLSVLMVAMPVYAAATTVPQFVTGGAPDVFITEFQTNGGTAAQEFVELYNSSDQDINFGDASQAGLDQWKLQFFNSTAVKTGAPTWATTPTISNSITLSGTISAHDYFILASTGYQPGNVAPDEFYSPSSSHLMTDTGGGLQLMSTTGASANSVFNVHDRIMWLDSAANSPLPTGVLASPVSGKSLQRLPNDDSEYLNPDSTLTGFSNASAISPLDAWQPPLPPVVMPPVVVVSSDPPVTGDGTTDDSTVDADPATPVGGNTPEVLLPPAITELLPNPASPLTDADDEFIELYNPNDASIDLKGYSLEVGTTTLHDFTFSDTTIVPALGYVAFYSADTHLSLANSGGQARVRNPAGEIVSETGIYGTAAEGQSWVQTDGAWLWTTTVTPNAANSVNVPVTTTKAPTAAKTGAAKTTTAKKTSTKTASKAKGTTTTKKAKAKAAPKKKKAKTTKAAPLSTAASLTPKTPIHTGVLVAVAIAAVLYGLYEYRHDISDKLRQLKENRTGGRPDRNSAAWRRGYSSE